MTFHEHILAGLLAYRKRNPTFKFIPRQKNNNNRLEKGYWFQGEDYAFVGLFDRSGGMNKTRSFGIVFWPKSKNTFGCYLELVYKGETDKNVLAGYDKIKESFPGFVDKGGEKFYNYLPDCDMTFETLFTFLDGFYPKLQQLVSDQNLSFLFIEEEKFAKILRRINQQRDILQKRSSKVLIELISKYVANCQSTSWLDDELYKFEWARWLHEKADFDNESSDATLYQLAIDSQKINYSGSTGVQFIKQGAREQMSKYIGIDDIRYFREFSEGKSLDEIGFEHRNMSFPIVSCWLATFFPDKIYPVSRVSFADVIQKVFSTKVNNNNISFIEDLQPYCKQIDQLLQKETGYQELLKNKLKTSSLSQLDFNWTVQDFMLFLDRKPEIFNTKPDENKIPMNDSNLNQILFGPPGTGKTFNTINEALKIVDPEYFALHQKDRNKLTDRFKELLIKNKDEDKGQIAFCTFHQSFGYEDFVEGIKPKVAENKSVYYDIEAGIFKRICQLAESNNSTVKVIKDGKISWTEDEFNRASFYKLSLGEYNNPADRPIYEYCRDNNYIAIGFGEENDFTGLSESQIKEKCEDLELGGISAQQLNYFIHYLKKNNYVIVSNGNNFVRALGKVIGDYEFVEESPIRYNHFRKVEWLFVDENIPIDQIYDRGLSQKTMYKIDENALKQDFFTNKGQQHIIESKEEKKFVIVIDEINRGNVSSIFGELITLIEKDKRAGMDEELEVTLPYSKEPFKVPGNVYIIGTMNTADRSVEALDTALRRRFSFKEFPPKPHILRTEGKSGDKGGIIDGIDLEKLLNDINFRIEKLIDKDHKIGHSYFLKVDSLDDLRHAFKNEIVPLLEEYFFGDCGKIGLVLGSSFVEKVNHYFEFSSFDDYDNDVKADLKEKLVYKIKSENLWDFTKI